MGSDKTSDVGGDRGEGKFVLRWPAGKLVDFMNRFSGVMEKSGAPPSATHLRMTTCNGVLKGEGRGKQVHVEAEEELERYEEDLAWNVEYWPMVRILKTLRRDEEVCLVLRARDLLLSGQRSRHPIATQKDELCSARELELVQADVRSQMEMGGPELMSVIEAMKHAMGEGNEKDEQNGASLRWSADEWWLKARTPRTDARMRLHVMRCGGERGQWQMRRSAAIEVLRQLKGFKGSVKLAVGERTTDEERTLLCEIRCGRNVTRSELTMGKWGDEGNDASGVVRGGGEQLRLIASVKTSRQGLVDGLKRMAQTRGKSEEQVVDVEMKKDEWTLGSCADRNLAEERVSVEPIGRGSEAVEADVMRMDIHELLGAVGVGSSYSVRMDVMQKVGSATKGLMIRHESHEGFEEFVEELSKEGVSEVAEGWNGK